MTVEEKIEKLVDDINEILKEDRGELIFIRYESETQTAVFKLTGIFDYDPMSMNTFRGGVERYICNRLSEVRRIERIF